MRNFIVKSIAFLVVASVLPIIVLWYLFVTNKFESYVNGSEVYSSIKKSTKKSKKRKLLLGDSVAKQLVMYNKNNSKINSLACNQAISMVGHYLLFKNYLEAENKIDTLIILINPLVSFKNNLDQLFTFHYFLKPFYTDQYKSEFSETVNNQIHKIPFYSTSQFPLIKATNWSPEFKSTDPKLTTFLSPISREYLLKIKNLAEKNNITLLIYPPPLRKSLKPSIDSIRASNINVQGLEKEFDIYFNRVRYIDDQYYVDQPHFKKKFLVSHPNLLSEIL